MSDAPSSPPAPIHPGRRYLTLLFADLSNSTLLSDLMEAEHYAAMLAALRRIYQETVQRHGGTVVRVQGDGLLAMFGHPEAREDDGRRAVETALELHALVRRLRPPVALPAPNDGPLTLHSGIHSGLVLVEAGDVERGRFELLGPVPNVAARLSSSAKADEILVSEETLGPASHYFDVGEPVALRVRGRDTPVLVYHVQALAAAGARWSTPSRRGPSTFVGREAEFEQLEHRLREAMLGQVRLVQVTAAPGMGKTRLVGEFLRRAAQRDCQVLRGYCENHLSAEPLQPFLQMLRAVFGMSDGMSPSDAARAVETALAGIDPALAAQRELLLRLLSLGSDAPDARPPSPDATLQALTTLFAALAARKPLLLFVDDWQWADDASNQVLAAIRSLAQRAVFVILATREATHVAGAETVELRPLTDNEATEAIEHLLPAGDPFIAAEIRRHAGGNPLFIEELCHSAAHDDSMQRLGRVRTGAAWLNRLVESRVERLPTPQAAIVRAAAVIGNVVPAWLLERLTGCAEDDALVRGLAELDLIFPGERAGTLRFKHGITRDVVYDSVGLHERRAMHLRIAELLQQHSADVAQEEALEPLAYHFAAGGNVPQTVHYAELAGDKAAAASALDRAKTQYRAALAALEQLPASPQRSQRYVSISQRLGLVCVFDAARSDLPVFERAVALAEELGDEKSIARTTYWLGFIRYSLGETLAAVALCDRALAAARRAGDDPLAVQIVATLGQAHTAAAQYDAALPLLDQAIAVKRQHRSGRRTNIGLAYALVCRAWVLGDRGRFDDAHACFDDARACIVGVTHEIGATTHGWHAAVLLWQGRWAEARTAALESARIADLTRSLFQLSIARAIADYADWMLERRPESLQSIVTATAWLDPRAGGLFRSLNHGWLADGFAFLGDVTQTRRYAARALMRARQRDLIGVAMAYRALAHVAADAGQPAAARRYLDGAMRTAQARDSAHEIATTQLAEAAIALREGDRPRALARLDEAQPAFEAMGMAWHAAEAARLRAQAASATG